MTHTATFLSPHGICIELWGEVRIATAEVVEMDELEEVETPSEVEAMDEIPKQPLLEKSSDPDDDFRIYLKKSMMNLPGTKASKPGKLKLKISEDEDDFMMRSKTSMSQEQIIQLKQHPYR